VRDGQLDTGCSGASRLTLDAKNISLLRRSAASLKLAARPVKGQCGYARETFAGVEPQRFLKPTFKVARSSYGWEFPRLDCRPHSLRWTPGELSPNRCFKLGYLGYSGSWRQSLTPRRDWAREANLDQAASLRPLAALFGKEKKSFPRTAIGHRSGYSDGEYAQGLDAKSHATVGRLGDRAFGFGKQRCSIQLKGPRALISSGRIWVRHLPQAKRHERPTGLGIGALQKGVISKLFFTPRGRTQRDVTDLDALETPLWRVLIGVGSIPRDWCGNLQSRSTPRRQHSQLG
jgi:hypothetical protein